MREYENLMECIGVSKDNTGAAITPQDFKTGCMILALDTSGDRCNSFHTHMLKSGQIRCTFSYATAPTKPLKLIVLHVYHKIATIDRDRSLKIDYIT